MGGKLSGLTVIIFFLLVCGKVLFSICDNVVLENCLCIAFVVFQMPHIVTEIALKHSNKTVTPPCVVWWVVRVPYYVAVCFCLCICVKLLFLVSYAGIHCLIVPSSLPLQFIYHCHCCSSNRLFYSLLSLCFLSSYSSSSTSFIFHLRSTHFLHLFASAVRN